MMEILKISVCICSCRFRKLHYAFPILNISCDEYTFTNKIYNTRNKYLAEKTLSRV